MVFFMMRKSSKRHLQVHVIMLGLLYVRTTGVVSLLELAGFVLLPADLEVRLVVLVQPLAGGFVNLRHETHGRMIDLFRIFLRRGEDCRITVFEVGLCSREFLGERVIHHRLGRETLEENLGSCRVFMYLFLHLKYLRRISGEMFEVWGELFLKFKKLLCETSCLDRIDILATVSPNCILVGL